LNIIKLINKYSNFKGYFRLKKVQNEAELSFSRLAFSRKDSLKTINEENI
jgi:hypothetical protein